MSSAAAAWMPIEDRARPEPPASDFCWRSEAFAEDLGDCAAPAGAGPALLRAVLHAAGFRSSELRADKYR
ncbi:hypothetical protein CKO44_09795 [Rubrivivax gelatinosus]|uniref:hypothetical protein n=1 Tax=Rubrivivax gelatinosus TaxID=28068 RepID=UPI001906F093|nr:hypothetical protein [Rubrivivax gelatinosus]MBK1613761.1 hypothetical protein [Rubrivivax gelatinosus]